MDGKRIKDITSEGITYLDDEGHEQFIDFAECYANYVKKETSPEYREQMKQLNNWTDADWEKDWEKMADWKQVGYRDFGAKPPYIELQTEPRTFFTFATQEEFQKARMAIFRAGWQTSDLA
jgi:hypothetical protein